MHTRSPFSPRSLEEINDAFWPRLAVAPPQMEESMKCENTTQLLDNDMMI